MKKHLLFLLLWTAVSGFGTVSCSKDDEPQQIVAPNPDDTPDDPGSELAEVVLTAGEWMYYGPFGGSREDIYFLSLKNDNGSEIYYNMGFYVNVPTVEKSTDLENIPLGEYVVSDEQIPGHINNDRTERGHSFWWTVDPEMQQHMIVSGKLNIARTGSVYTITGTVMEDETRGLKFSYTGELPVGDYSEKEWPDLADRTHSSIVLNEGELMYYGKFEQSQEAVYYLYLKNKSSEPSYFMGFYVNVGKAADKKNLVLTPGRYTSDSSWAVGTFNDSSASKKSFWYTVDSQGTQVTHYVKSGEFEVAYDNGTYTISGTVCEEDGAGTIRTLDIFYEGQLPVEDYSDPDPDPVVDAVTFTVGELYYYGAENGADIYYLNLKDEKPMKDNEITLYLFLPAEKSLHLETGDYEASDVVKAWSFGVLNNPGGRSVWYTKDQYGRLSNKVTGGKVHVERAGENYTITGAVTAVSELDDSIISLSFGFAGGLICEDYS